MNFGRIFILRLYTINVLSNFHPKTIDFEFWTNFHPKTMLYEFFSNFHRKTIHYEFWPNFYPKSIDYEFWSNFYLIPFLQNYALSQKNPQFGSVYLTCKKRNTVYTL